MSIRQSQRISRQRNHLMRLNLLLVLKAKRLFSKKLKIISLRKVRCHSKIHSSQEKLLRNLQVNWTRKAQRKNLNKFYIGLISFRQPLMLPIMSLPKNLKNLKNSKEASRMHRKSRRDYKPRQLSSNQNKKLNILNL